MPRKSKLTLQAPSIKGGQMVATSPHVAIRILECQFDRHIGII